MEIACLDFYGGLRPTEYRPFIAGIAPYLTAAGHQLTVYQNGRRPDTTDYRLAYLPSPYLIPPWTSHPDIVIPLDNPLQQLAVRLWTLKNRKKYLLLGHSGQNSADIPSLLTFPDVFLGWTDLQCQAARKINPFLRAVRISPGNDADSGKKSDMEPTAYRFMALIDKICPA